MTVWANSVTCFGVVGLSTGYNDLINWPSILNRPQFNSGTNTLSWIGPLNGGASTAFDKPQTRVLTNSPGNFTTSSNGQVVQGLNITGNLTCQNTGVTIKQCRITGGIFASSALPGGPFAPTVEDCLIPGAGTGSGDWGHVGGGIIRRCDISGFENGISCDTVTPMSIFDNYIHDLNGAGSPHIDGIEVNGGVNGLVIQHNQIQAWNTSCVNINNDFGGNNDIQVNNNLLINDPLHPPGTNVPFISDEKIANPGQITNVSVTNNIMQIGDSGGYGEINNNVVVWTNNTDYITGLPINP